MEATRRTNVDIEEEDEEHLNKGLNRKEWTEMVDQLSIAKSNQTSKQSSNTRQSTLVTFNRVTIAASSQDILEPSTASRSREQEISDSAVNRACSRNFVID